MARYYKSEIEQNIKEKYGDEAGLGEIFYSPQKNSCLYGVIEVNYQDELVITFEYTILDYLNNKTVYSDECSNTMTTSNDNNECNNFFDNIKIEIEKLKISK